MTMGQTNIEETENVDKTQWIPQGEEVVPAAALIRGHVVSIGSHYTSTDTNIVDRLLVMNRINDSHHFIALKLLNLLRLGTSKQGFATMQIFSPSRGYDNSDYCPMTIFIKVTRSLKPSQLKWIRAVCGLDKIAFATISANADYLRDALEKAEENLYAYEQALQNASDEDAPDRY